MATQPQANAASPATPSALWPLPLATKTTLAPYLLGIILLSMIPALILVVQRVQYEQSQKTAALVMDYPALVGQARRFGLEPQVLLDKYKALGINGIALYEDVIGSLVQRGDIYLKNGSDLANENPTAKINTQYVYMRSLKAGVAESLPAKYTIPTKEVTIAGKKWIEWPTDPQFLPVGPNNALVKSLKAQNLTLIYRPYTDDAVKEIGLDWPDVPFIAFTGDEVIGARTPELLSEVDNRLGKRVPALAEGNAQLGLDTLIESHGAARLFAFNPTWQNRLTPDETASKYNLAARERSMRLLYFRPYPTINETEDLLKRTTELLGKSGIKITEPIVAPFVENNLLRALCVFGPLAALLWLGLSYPLVRLGLIVAALSALLAVGLNGKDVFSGVALIAAVTFPALGIVLRRSKVTDWFFATGLSLIGVLFVSGLGTNTFSVAGLEPFHGVGLTLVLPLVLVALSFLPRQNLRQMVITLYNTPIKVGDVMVIGLGFMAFSLVLLRRGNTTSGSSVSSIEGDLRRDIQDSMVRPRFKEIAGHPLGILGLSGLVPGYLGAMLILGGVVGQSSILNTFSHFHTPFLISATRCFLGLGIGMVFGFILIEIVKFVLSYWKKLNNQAVNA